MWGLFSWVLWRTTRTYRDFPWRSSRLIKRSFHHCLWHLPYIEVLVCHKQRVEVSHSNLSIERSWVPFRCWVSLCLMGFTSHKGKKVVPRIAIQPDPSRIDPKYFLPILSLDRILLELESRSRFFVAHVDHAQWAFTNLLEPITLRWVRWVYPWTSLLVLS